MMAAGSVSTHAINRLRTVAHCSPEPLAAIVPATPDDNTCVVETGSPYMSAAGDRSGGDHFGAGALAIGHVNLADFFPDRDDDALPSDHGAQSERDRDRDLDPQGNELGRVVERCLVGGQLCDLLLAEVVFLVLHQEAD